MELFVVILRGVLWGWATYSIIKNKNYDTNWFWYGFFFGLIAFVIALTRPENVSHSTYQSYSSIFPDEERKDGDWKCNNCGKVHSSYVGTCECGNSKYNNVKKAAPATQPVLSNVEKIKQYKGLLDSGAITQEEYEKKKQELLNQQ